MAPSSGSGSMGIPPNDHVLYVVQEVGLGGDPISVSGDFNARQHQGVLLRTTSTGDSLWMRLTLTDAAGRVVEHEERLGNSTLNSINLQHPTGNYQLHLHDATRWIAGAKLMLEQAAHCASAATLLPHSRPPVSPALLHSQRSFDFQASPAYGSMNGPSCQLMAAT